jgi:hypothetical protein
VRDAWLAQIDDWIADMVELLVRASSFGIPQTGWGFAYAWKVGAFGGLLKQVDELITRWDTRLTEFGTRMTEYGLLPLSARGEERINHLQRSEMLVSTQFTNPIPADLDDLRDAILAKGAAMTTRRGQFAALVTTLFRWQHLSSIRGDCPSRLRRNPLKSKAVRNKSYHSLAICGE